MQDWALAYATVGFRVFPLWPGQKRPMYENWPKDATTDPELIRRYWQPGSDRNIGVVCGEAFDAWDIEAAHLPLVEEWMGRRGLTLPEGPLARTARGGIHLLTEPTGVNGSRNLYVAGTHVGELKSAGGFIVVAPSAYKDEKTGTEGAWSWTWRPDKLAVSPAPAWLLTWLERPKSVVHKFPDRITDVEQGIRRLEVLAAAVREAGEGRRNNYLYWAMRRAMEEGIPARYAGAELRDTAVAVGLDRHEAEATIRSAYHAEGAA